MGCIKDITTNPITTALEDVALTISGNPEFIPLANAATRTVGGVSSGESFGKAIGQGAISGAEALGFQEAAGAIGIGEGNMAVNDALGINISPAATGLPDVGGFISKGVDKVGSALGFSPSGTATSVAGTSGGNAVDASGQTLTPTPTSTTSVSPVSGGGPVSATQALNAGSSSIDTLLGASTSAPTGLGSVAPQLGGATEASIDSLSAPFSSGVNSVANAAPAGAASAAAPTSGGFWSSLESAAGKAALPLGAVAYEALQGPAALPSATNPLNTSGAVTAPLIAAETQGLNNYNSGTLSQPQQAQVLKFVKNSQNELIQQLVNQGVSNFKTDSRYIQGMQDIQEKSIAMQNQMLQQTFDNAFHAAGAAGANLSSVANEQVSLDKDFQDAMAAAFAGVGAAAGGGAFRSAA